jgi:hypothetical protein
MEVSKCCGSIPWNDTDICAECKEHADFIYYRVLTKAEKKFEEKCDECKMSMADHTTCECCQEPMCEDEDKTDMPEGWYHPDCHSDVYG